MVTKNTILNQSTAEEIISLLARERRLDERIYLDKIAKKSFVLAKPTQKGIRVAVWDNNMPILFDSKESAEEEINDTDNSSITYNGYKPMCEYDLWDSLKAVDIFFFAVK